jgi:hypothetical protein
MKSSRLEVRVMSEEEESPSPYEELKCEVKTLRVNRRPDLCVIFGVCSSVI